MKIVTWPRQIVIRRLKDNQIDFSKENLISVNTFTEFGYEGWQSELDEMKELIPEEFQKNVLFLEFDDVVLGKGQLNLLSKEALATAASSFKFFDEEMAKQVIEFLIKTFEEHKDLIVHCTAGVSRSAAISIFANRFVNKILSNDDNGDFRHNELYGFYRAPNPNSLVKETLEEVAAKQFR